MAEITLIAVAESREGFEFDYQGGAPICRTCAFRHACLTLDPGRRYAVTRVRPVTHPCAMTTRRRTPRASASARMRPM